MAQLKVYTYPEPILKTVAAKYKGITDQERQLASDMLETMYADNGVGLAAPQVGVSRRLIVCGPQQKEGQEYVFFNPVIKNKKGEVLGPEGCLSLPGVSGEVLRAAEIDLEALDLKGNPVKMHVTDFFARIIQHEVDHLDGILFVDRVNYTARQSLLESYHDVRPL